MVRHQSPKLAKGVRFSPLMPRDETRDEFDSSLFHSPMPGINNRMKSHRHPPLPEWFNDIRPGICRWCNDAIPPTKTGRASKATWHTGCVTDYRAVAHPSFTRKLIWRRDQGVCRKCGCVCKRRGKPAWHVDHIQPLIDANGDLSFWQMGNLQTLCVECHTAKTVWENRTRIIGERDGM